MKSGQRKKEMHGMRERPDGPRRKWAGKKRRKRKIKNWVLLTR